MTQTKAYRCPDGRVAVPIYAAPGSEAWLLIDQHGGTGVGFGALSEGAEPLHTLAEAVDMLELIGRERSTPDDLDVMLAEVAGNPTAWAAFTAAQKRAECGDGTPTDLEILQAHRWDPKERGCRCGWTQRRRVPRGAEHVNHPHHLNHMLRTRSLTYPPTSEVLAWGVQS